MTTEKTEIVMDTNVAVVANGQTAQASPNCVRKCIESLRQIRKDCRILLDDKDLILKEYRTNLRPSGQPGPGDAFYKLLYESLGNPAYCRTVAVNLHPDRVLEEFPEDPSLSSFHHKDRKFVAVALASGTDPQILNACDPGWWQHRQELLQHGVDVVFLCPELMNV